MVAKINKTNKYANKTKNSSNEIGKILNIYTDFKKIGGQNIRKSIGPNKIKPGKVGG